MKKQVWSFLIAIVAVILGLGGIVFGNWIWAGLWALLAVTAWRTACAWQRRNPAPMPFFMRWALFLPRGHSPRRLIAILEPRPGERILEVGPGTGIHAIPVAAALRPGGTLEAIDVQQEMVETLKQRAARQGAENIVAVQGDAQALPYADHTFDAAYMITTLGEIPDQGRALRELRRVLKPEGRLVIAEVIIDPDYVTPSTVETTLRNEGFVLDRRIGTGLSYFARFRKQFTTKATNENETERSDPEQEGDRGWLGNYLEVDADGSDIRKTAGHELALEIKDKRVIAKLRKSPVPVSI